MDLNLPKLILGIETSCDDTSLAIFDSLKNQVVHQLTYSQTAKHAKFGGVVPEIAGREHLTALPSLFKQILKICNIKKEDIDCIAVTVKPGLIGSLLIGFNYAKSLAFCLDKPLIGVDHLKAHIFSVFIDQGPVKTPFLSLLASGGHTQLCLVKGLYNITTLGKTLDDACGEAFDKAAQMMGLTYPGGVNIEKLAKLQSLKKNNPYVLPIPFKNYPSKQINFSYSGLKTALRRLLIKQNLYAAKSSLKNYAEFTTNLNQNTIKNLSLIAQAFQTAAFDQLIINLKKAALATGIRQVAICGGVSANMLFKQKLAMLCQKLKLDFLTPKFEYTVDNGAMVAFLAKLYFAHHLNKNANLPLELKTLKLKNFVAKNFKVKVSPFSPL